MISWQVLNKKKTIFGIQKKKNDFSVQRKLKTQNPHCLSSQYAHMGTIWGHF
jgi:hypothetical protein